MATINISDETKEEFKRIKLDMSYKEKSSISEEEAMKRLIKDYKEKYGSK